jgi:hypothetical protein
MSRDAKYSGVERRRSVRAQPVEEHELRVGVSLSVKVLDISLSGVSLASKSELAVGERADLHVAAGPRSVNLPIQVQRVSIDPNAPRGRVRYCIGAIFAPMTAEQRVTLEQLLGAEQS